MMKSKMMAGGGMMKKGYAAGGVAKEGKMMKKEGRGMAKADMQKVATKTVKKHEQAMHGAKKGGVISASKMGAVKTAKPSMGSASKRADGVATKGKTRGMMLRKGGMC